jgi:hypothetical protein
MGLKPALVYCAICRESSQVLISESAESKEPPDFDTRPGRPARSSIVHWVHRCPGCGYCAHDLEAVTPEIQEYVKGAMYQAFLANKVFPPKATEFLAYALILEEIGALADAGWTALHAAWVSDDAADARAGRGCRERAIELWKRSKEQGESFLEDLYQEFALVCDVHRRLGEWEAARSAAQEGLESEGLPVAVEAMLRRQLALIDRKDDAAHNMGELKKPLPGAAPVRWN